MSDQSKRPIITDKLSAREQCVKPEVHQLEMRTALMDQSRVNASSYLQENQGQQGNNPLLCKWIRTDVVWFPVADSGFPRGTNPRVSAENLLFDKILAKNLMKMKEMGPGGCAFL